MKAQNQDILAREKKRQRKERTHCLIQIGALSEKYFDMKDVKPIDYEIFLKTFMTVQNIPECIMNTKNQEPVNQSALRHAHKKRNLCSIQS